MRSIHIYCDGGFGNRFNGLVSGLLIAKASGLNPIVVWPCNNWCGASYSDLFDTEAVVIERELVSYVPDKDAFHFFMTEDHLNMGVVNQSPLQMSSLGLAVAYINSSEKDVYFHTPLIPGFFEAADISAQINQLRIRGELIARAAAFMADRQLTDYFGIHIRKTDFGTNGSDDNGLFELLSNCPTKKFFVCSDDEGVEARFSSLPHVSTYPKRAYVQTLLAGDWNTPTADHSGRVYACNVDRNAISVEDAVIDLLVLSHSQIVDTSKSTFRNIALLMQTARKAAEIASSLVVKIDNPIRRFAEKIAIFIPVFNEDKYLKKTINSVLAQDYENFELLISENHSTDGSFDIVHDARKSDSRIKLIQPPTKLNSNFAIQSVSNGGYHASMMLGGHDLLSKNVLSSCMSALNAHPKSVIALQTNTFEIDELDNVTRKWPSFHESGHMNSAFDATLTLLSLMYNTPIFGLWRQTAREKVSFRYPCVGGDHLYVAEAVAHGSIVPCADAEVYLRRSPVTDNYLNKHFVDASGDAAAAADMAIQLTWLCEIIDICTKGYPEYAKALHRVSAVSLYLMRYDHHFQTFGSTVNSILKHPALSKFVDGQMQLSQKTLSNLL
jgi:hypothetical protein